MKALGNFFAYILSLCNDLTGNQWLAIVLFTLISKIILLPVSILVQKNSIKMVKMYPEMNRIKAQYFGNKDMISEKQYELYQKEHYHPMFDLFPVALQLILLLGITVAFPSSQVKNPIYMPILAALSALIMCFAQNRSNVLQSEQSRANKWGTLLFSVALSLYLGFFVSKEVAFYWICSNLMATAQMYLLNWFINPKKYIDYEDLDESRKELERIKQQSKSVKTKRSSELVSREKSDFKRFLNYENKQIVFYSEKNGFYKYFKDIIEIILNKTDIIIHYISSDPDDEIFGLSSEQFQTYYIDEKLMILMMQMDADIVVMTTPDLQNYYIKRSRVRNDIEYIYIDHAMNSMNLTYHKGALDYYDTIFVQNELNYNEIRTQEKVYGLKEKNLVKSGYSLIDNMIKARSTQLVQAHEIPEVLIAPSWQEGNIMDTCIDALLGSLLPRDLKVTVRPHPQYVRHFGEKLKVLEDKYKSYANFMLQTDFSSNETVLNVDVLVTDWSGIAYEYTFSTLKPCLYVDTPMKIMNPDYKDIDIEPFDVMIRNKIGISIAPENVVDAYGAVLRLLNEDIFSRESVESLRAQYLYNVGSSASVGARYIINKLIEKSRQS